MIRRRAAAAGIKTKIGCHTFRATGITAYLKNGGRLEVAQQMAGHESSRTTGLYDRRGDEVSLDEELSGLPIWSATRFVRRQHVPLDRPRESYGARTHRFRLQSPPPISSDICQCAPGPGNPTSATLM